MRLGEDCVNYKNRQLISRVLVSISSLLIEQANLQSNSHFC